MARRLAGYTIIALAALGAAVGSSSMAAPAGARVVPPPRAYIEFCFREPQECPSVDTAAQAAGLDRGRGAASEYWRQVFAADEPQALSGPEAGHGAADEQVDRSSELAQIAEVNSAVNRSLAERSDASVYGRSDYWALPLSHGQAGGDCEDFVLEKRRALRGLGYTERQMSIAVVRAPWGQAHAVLLVSTPAGEVVLDNLSPRIEPWSRSSYTLLARQSATDPSIWLGAP